MGASAGDSGADIPPLAWLAGPEAATGDRRERLLVLGRIWATVELERALADLGLDPARAGDATDDPLLGARVVVIEETPGDGAVILAEPSTEGRLAATLARHGEGPAGHYLASPVGLDEVRRRAALARVAISRPEIGPFGRSVLVIDGPPAGRSLLVVEPRRVPSRP